MKKRPNRIIDSEEEYVNEDDEEDEAVEEEDEEKAPAEKENAEESEEEIPPVVPKKILNLPKLEKVPKSPRARGRGRGIGGLQRPQGKPKITISPIIPPPSVTEAEPPEEDEEEQNETEQEDDANQEKKEKAAIPPDIPVIAANPDDLDDEEIGMMMEEEEYANKQLELMAIQLAKEKERRRLEAEREKTKLTVSFAPPPVVASVPAPVENQPKKRGRRKKFVEGVSPLKQQLQQQARIPPIIINKALITPPPVLNNEEIEPEKTIIPTENLSLVPTVVEDLSMSPTKRRGRGKGKKTLEAEAARSGDAIFASENTNMSAGSSDSNFATNSPEPNYQSAKLSIASAPQPFTQSQPTPSVITRMLQSQPLPTQPFTTAANAMNQKYFGSMTNEQPRGMLPQNQFPNMNPRARIPGPYRQNIPQNPYQSMRQGMSQMPPHRLRNPGGNPQNLQQMFHSHHPLDPSPSGGGHVMTNLHRDRQSPLENKGGPTPPPQYRPVMPPGSNRFPGSDMSGVPVSRDGQSPLDKNERTPPPQYSRAGMPPGNMRYPGPNEFTREGQFSLQNKGEIPPPQYTRAGGSLRFPNPSEAFRDGASSLEGKEPPQYRSGMPPGNRFPLTSEALARAMPNLLREAQASLEARSEPPQYNRPNMPPGNRFPITSEALARGGQPSLENKDNRPPYPMPRPNMPNVSREEQASLEKGMPPQYSRPGMLLGNIRFPGPTREGASFENRPPGMPPGSAYPGMPNVPRDGHTDNKNEALCYSRPGMAPGNRFPRAAEPLSALPPSNMSDPSQEEGSFENEDEASFKPRAPSENSKFSGAGDAGVSNLSRDGQAPADNKREEYGRPENQSQGEQAPLENKDEPKVDEAQTQSDMAPREGQLPLEKSGETYSRPTAHTRFSEPSSRPNVPQEGQSSLENKGDEALPQYKKPPGHIPGTNVSREGQSPLEIKGDDPPPHYSRANMPFPGANEALPGSNAPNIPREGQSPLETKGDDPPPHYNRPGRPPGHKFGTNEFPGTNEQSPGSNIPNVPREGQSPVEIKDDEPPPPYNRPGMPPGHRFPGANEPNVSREAQSPEIKRNEAPPQYSRPGHIRFPTGANMPREAQSPVENRSADPLQYNRPGNIRAQLQAGFNMPREGQDKGVESLQYSRPPMPSRNIRFPGPNEGSNMPNVSRGQSPLENRGSEYSKPDMPSGNVRFPGANPPQPLREAQSSLENRNNPPQYARAGMPLGNNRFPGAIELKTKETPLESKEPLQYSRPTGSVRFPTANEALPRPNIPVAPREGDNKDDPLSYSKRFTGAGDSVTELSNVPRDEASIEQKEDSTPQYNRVPTGRYPSGNDSLSGPPTTNIPPRDGQENKEFNRSSATPGNNRFPDGNDLMPRDEHSNESKTEGTPPFGRLVRFPGGSDNIPGPSGPNVRPQHVSFPSGNQLQPSSPSRAPSGENFTTYPPSSAPNYHYGAYPPPPSLTAADDALPPTAYQNSSYPEQYNNPDNVAQSSEGSNSKTFDEEGSGEFGGLVSYFSSQREDDLDA